MPHEPAALVTGATGMIGGAIVRALRARGHPVRVLARDPARARAIFGSSVEIAGGDLGAQESLGRACAGIEEIYHAAAALGLGVRDAEIMQTNVEGTRRLLTVARTHGVTRIVLTSSVAVYGDRSGSSVDEGTPANAAGAYGVSKVQAESLVRAAGDEGMRCVMVRPCIVYGPGDRYFLQQVSRVSGLPVIPLPSGGAHLVDLVHADDVAAAHLIAMEHGQPGEAYNVTDGMSYRVRDIIRWLAEALGRSPRLLPVPLWAARGSLPLVRLAGRFGRIPSLANLSRDDVGAFYADHHFDIGKIRALGYSPRILAPEGLRSVLTASPPA